MIRSMSERLGALIAANFIAAVTVGGGSALLVVADSVLAPHATDNGVAALVGLAAFVAVMAFIIGAIAAFPAYLVGLIAVGIPTWWVLHRLGWASTPVFVCVAAAESMAGGAVAALVIAPEALVFAPLLAVPGAVVGLVLWRLGYESIRPPRPRPVRPS